MQKRQKCKKESGNAKFMFNFNNHTKNAFFNFKIHTKKAKKKARFLGNFDTFNLVLTGNRGYQIRLVRNINEYNQPNSLKKISV